MSSRDEPLKPVWIIDDDRSIRWVFEKALAREGIAHRTFGAAKEALDRLAEETPQVVVTDIRMPGVSGLDLMQQLKGRIPATPVIIMTAYSDLESAVAAFQGGAFEYLPKPFDVDHAVELVRRALEESRRQVEVAPADDETPEILGQAPAMQEVFRAIGRLRHGEGAGRARAASPQPARGEGVHRHQHGGDSARPPRKRALRARARRLHRRAGDAPRPLRAGRRRHALPRRDRRHAAGAADAAAARSLRRPVLSRRRAHAARRERARHRRHAPGPRCACEAGPLPRRPLPPAQRDPAPAAGAA